MLQLWFFANTILWIFSIKPGGITFRLNIVLLILAGAVWLGKNQRIAVGSLKALFAFFVFAIFSFIVALTGPCTDHLQKSLLATPILMILVLMGLEAGRTARNSDWLKLRKTASWALILAFLSFIIEMLRPAWFPNQERYRSKGELSGLFEEPSQAAFSLFPCIAVLLVSEDKKTRRIGILALVGLLVFSRSSTLIIFTVVWFLYRLIIQRKLRKAVIFVVSIGLIIALSSVINYDALLAPTVNRIVGVSQTDASGNISSLVYIQGWQDAWNNLVRTHGLGLGLNMMGCSPLPNVSVRNILALQGLEDLNAEDGSFVFAKIVSEIGVLAVVFYIAVVWWWVRLEREIRLHGNDEGHSAATMQAALIFCFVTASFLRGPGYYGGELLLWVAAVSGASKWRKKFLMKPANGPNTVIEVSDR